MIFENTEVHPWWTMNDNSDPAGYVDFVGWLAGKTDKAGLEVHIGVSFDVSGPGGSGDYVTIAEEKYDGYTNERIRELGFKVPRSVALDIISKGPQW